MSIPSCAIECLEARYLNEIWSTITGNINTILERIRLGFLVKESWYPIFEEVQKESKRRLTDLGIGVERIFHWKFAKEYDWKPCSIPLGSNLFYETDDAFINIDVKTAYVENGWDYLGLVIVGEAQTTYPMQKKWGARKKFQPRLSKYYKVQEKIKVCLTYVLQIVHVSFKKIQSKGYDPNPIAIMLVSVPHGDLYSIYGDDICGEPKNFKKKNNVKIRPKNFRFLYSKAPYFHVIYNMSKKKNYRIKVLFNKEYVDMVFSDVSWKRKKITIQLNPVSIVNHPNQVLIRAKDVAKFTKLFSVKDNNVILENYKV
ncbi:MAG: hypothetical protein B6U76_05835 [Desulfurococcales archaeon ex4484_217_2]|nr:MAG: hypothetical protein B6U76_05835 [Desulfurococcales archaeon ex4484_217_2]